MDAIIDKFSGKFDCEVSMPGSKSYTNRVFVIAALAKGKTRIISPLHSDDTKHMIESLQKLGISVSVCSNGDVEIIGTGGEFDIGKCSSDIFVGIAGTTSRFLTAFCSLVGKEIFINGEGKILERPINDLVDGLKQIGVSVEYKAKVGSIPLSVNGRNINGNEISINGNISSQFFTALMLIAPALEKGLVINVIGEQISKSYIDITINLMEYFGVIVDNYNYKKYVIRPGQTYIARDYKVEGDWSSASYFCALSALHDGKITIKNLNNNSAQGDRNFPKILEKMGVDIDYIEDGVVVYGAKDKLVSTCVDMEQMPDTAMTIAIVASQAKGITKITGLSTLKDKETDRLQAVRNELGKMGIRVEIINNDSLEIFGGRAYKSVVETYKDHRVAMSFAVLATKIGGVRILDKDVVNKSFPEFWEYLKKVGIGVKFFEGYDYLFLTGFRGTGKSTICRELSKRIGWKCVEMDKLIVDKFGGKTIDEITNAGKDWEEFRRVELEVLAEVLDMKKVIISAGGGVAVNDVYNSIQGKTFGDLGEELLEKKLNGLVIFLDASEDEILRRIKSAEKNSKKTIRPLLNVDRKHNSENEGKLDILLEDSLKVYRERKEKYRFISHVCVDTSDGDIGKSVDEILRYLNL